jgi:hypothetical protein
MELSSSLIYDRQSSCSLTKSCVSFSSSGHKNISGLRCSFVTTRLVVGEREYKNGINQCNFSKEKRYYYECLLSDNLQGLIVS